MKRNKPLTLTEDVKLVCTYSKIIGGSYVNS